MRIRIGIIGGAGYTGGELLRLLINHPQAEIAFVHSNSSAGMPLHKVHQDLLGETEIVFTTELHQEIDVLFLCTGHGEARKFLQANPPAAHVKLIDLSNDFRLSEQSTLELDGNETIQFIYGLPELNRDAIRKARAIANPGCFATSIQLGLLPLAQAGLLTEIYTTGITGSTGAGQSLSSTSHFSWRSNNIQAYKTLTHQHLGEIGQSLRHWHPEAAIDLSFVPWRGDFARGIFISSTMHMALSYQELESLYIDYYTNHPFTFISKEPIFLKQVVNTNKAIIQLEKVGEKLVVHSVIDNLLKGASGQAVQNMNLMFGLPEETGLRLKAGYF